MSFRHPLHAIGIALVSLGIATAPAIAQQAPPSTAAPAAAAPAKTAAPTAPPAHAARPASTGAAPDAPAAPQPNAPRNPHQQQQQQTAFGYQAPQDEVAFDETLPAGTLVVEARDPDGVPLAGVDLDLGILHESIARGNANENKKATTDATGHVRFDGLDHGAGHQYRVTTMVGPAKYMSPPFSLRLESGSRVALHLFEADESFVMTRIGMEAIVALSFNEDGVVVEQHHRIHNVGRNAWVADVAIPLAPGYKAFNVDDEMAKEALKIIDIGWGAALRGTVRPGVQDVSFRYQVPFEHAESLALTLATYPHTFRVKVITEASKKTKLAAPGFPEAQFVRQNDGRGLLVTQKQAVDRPLDPVFTVRLGGLSTRGAGGPTAAVIAGVVVLGGAAYFFLRRGKRELSTEELADLIEARETLLREIENLERAHRAGTIGPKTYGQARRELVDALARVVTRLEKARPSATTSPTKAAHAA